MVVSSRRSRRSDGDANARSSRDSGRRVSAPVESNSLSGQGQQEVSSSSRDIIEPLETFSLLDFAPNEISKLPVLFAFDSSNKESRKRAVKKQQKFAANRRMKLYLTIHEDLDDAPWCDTREANQDDIDVTPSHVMVEAYDISIQKPKKKKIAKPIEPVVSSFTEEPKSSKSGKSSQTKRSALKAKSSKAKGKAIEKKPRSTSLPPSSGRMTRSSGDVEDVVVDVEKILSRRGKKSTKPTSKARSKSVGPNKKLQGSAESEVESSRRSSSSRRTRGAEAQVEVVSDQPSSSSKKRNTRNSSGFDLVSKQPNGKKEVHSSSRRATRSSEPSTSPKRERGPNKRKATTVDTEETKEAPARSNTKKSRTSSTKTKAKTTEKHSSSSDSEEEEFKPIISVKGDKEVMTSIPAPEPIFAGSKGWIREEVLRVSGSTMGGVDKYWYSPKTRQCFKSLAECQRFLNCLIVTKGDEVAAIKLNRGQGL